MSAYLDADATRSRAEQTLRENGALFASLHGSRAHGQARTGSDIDVVAFFGSRDLGERPRMHRAHREFLESLRND